MSIIPTLAKLSCFSDITNRKPSHGRSVTILDGIRGMAALMVLADHTGLAPTAFGINGVWLFFVLSGYLLTIPFIRCHNFTAPWLCIYFIRRLLRILPMYVLYVIIAAYSLHLSHDWLIKHLLFQLSTGHLWTVKQELAFYLLLPFIVLITIFLDKNPLKIAVVFVFIAYISASSLTGDIFALTASIEGKFQPFYISPFIAGMAAAYFMESLKQYNLSTKYMGSIGGVFFAGIFVFLNWGVPGYSATHPWVMGLFFAAFVLWAQFIPGGIAQSIINSLFLRAIGIVGYSFYLLHWLVKEWFYSYKDVPILYFLLTMVTTYVLACVAYTVVEKPTMGLVK